MKWLKRLWCLLTHEVNTCEYCTVVLVVTQAEFDWLKDYGPLWEPATTAFWLAPDSEAEVEAWYRKYRPSEAREIYGRDLMAQYANAGMPQNTNMLQNYQRLCQQNPQIHNAGFMNGIIPKGLF